jgi:hypothetical protein
MSGPPIVNCAIAAIASSANRTTRVIFVNRRTGEG